MNQCFKSGISLPPNNTLYYYSLAIRILLTIYKHRIYGRLFFLKRHELWYWFLRICCKDAFFRPRFACKIIWLPCFSEIFKESDKLFSPFRQWLYPASAVFSCRSRASAGATQSSKAGTSILRQRGAYVRLAACCQRAPAEAAYRGPYRFAEAGCDYWEHADELLRGR